MKCNFKSKFLFLLVSILLGMGESYAFKMPGWLWYNEKAIPKKQPQKEKKDLQKKEAAVPNPYPATKLMEAKKARIDESIALAVLNPTVENVRNAIASHKEVIDSSENFQKAWTYVMATDEPFGTTIQNPKTKEILYEKQARQNKNILRKLSKTYGLFFVFSKDCPFCHEFAPVVKEFADEYGFEVLAITPDGVGIPEFPNPQRDNGIIRNINPEGRFPSLFLVNPKNQTIVPIAKSLLNREQLDENAVEIIKYLEAHRVS